MHLDKIVFLVAGNMWLPSIVSEKNNTSFTQSQLRDNNSLMIRIDGKKENPFPSLCPDSR